MIEVYETEIAKLKEMHVPNQALDDFIEKWAGSVFRNAFFRKRMLKQGNAMQA